MGKTKKEKKAKAEARVRAATLKKEKATKAAKIAKLAEEKKGKKDKWYKKGHLLFAQGTRYQALLDLLSKSKNKLEAYHYKQELKTYTQAFPAGFTNPLSSRDG